MARRIPGIWSRKVDVSGYPGWSRPVPDPTFGTPNMATITTNPDTAPAGVETAQKLGLLPEEFDRIKEILGELGLSLGMKLHNFPKHKLG